MTESESAPRWEWRTFGTDLGRAAERLAARELQESEESDEVYLLPRHCDCNVKVRAGRLDIKELVQTDPEGLELWRPVLGAGFPLPADALETVFAALGLPVPAAVPAKCGYAELLDLATAEPGLRVLPVHKSRRRFALGGCQAELTEIVADGRHTRSLAFECADRESLACALAELGLPRAGNTSYPRGLKALIGLGVQSDPVAGPAAGVRYAAIDVGTNSVKLHVGERDPAGHWHRVLDRVEVTRLGEGLPESGRIAPQAQARTLAAIASLAEQARDAGAAEVVAVGTMGLRTAANSADFIEAVRAACGLTIQVIGGDEEARLAFLAVREGLGLPEGAVAVFDSGGGSTQVTLGRGERVSERFSIDLGAVRPTERFGLGRAVGRETVDEALAFIAAELSRLDALPRPDALVGMGGAVTNLAAVSLGLEHYDPDRIQGAVLERAEVERQIGEYAAREGAERQAIRGLQPGRADIILAGACIVLTLMDKLGQERLRVSDRALRHGVLIDRFPT